MSATYNEQDPKDASTGNRLNRRARQFGTLAVDRTQGLWSAGAELQFSGDRFDDVANTRKLGGYGVLNLRGSYRLDTEWSLFGRVDNLFDKRYEFSRTSDTSYASLGTTLFAGIRYNLK